ncbi:tetratricopeptide repeat protein, partial [bacterium]|nr:tetratricopeptide repeat protein [bacterium]
VVEWHQEREEFSYPDGTPDYVKHLINRMTAKYPSDRFPMPSKVIEFINDRTEGRYKKIVSKMVGLMPGEGALVGREGTLQRVNTVIDEMRESKTAPQIGFAFTGQQGIGKSRLMKEIKYRAELAELAIREITCEASKDLVSEFMEQFKDVEPAKLASFDSSKPDPQRNYKIIQWASNLISKYKDKGLLIFVDDIQFSNEPFVELIAELEKRLYVAREEGNKIPIFLIIASRPKEDAPDIIQKWWQKTKVEEIQVKPLTDEDVEKYASSVGVKDFNKHKKAIHDFSNGVPQLVEAYCQHLMSPKGMARPPANLAQSYLARLRDLSGKSQTVLKTLSLSHRDLTIDELAEITEIEKDAMNEISQELMQLNFARRDFSSMQLYVENRAMAQVIKESLDEKELEDLSSKLGRWLEISDSEKNVDLANYFINTNDKKRIKKYSLEAAKQLEHAFNCYEAMKYYKIADKYVETDKEKLELIRAKAKLNIVIGNFIEAAKALEVLDKESKAIIDDYQVLGIAYSKLHEFPKAKSWYEKGLQNITDETAITDIVQFKNNLGNIHFYMGELEKSEKYFTEAIADATICLLLNNNLGLIYSAKGKYEDAIQFYDARTKYLEAKDNKRALAFCYAESGYIHMTNNHFSEAIRDFEKSYDLSIQIDDWHNILIVLGNLIRVYQQLSQYTKALETAQKSLEMEGRFGSLEDVAQTHLTVGILYESLGVFDLAKQHIDMAKDRFVAVNNKLMLGWCHLTNSFLNKDLGDLDIALTELSALDKIVIEIKNSDLKSWSELNKADIYLEQDEVEEAKILIDGLKNETGVEFALRKRLVTNKIDAINKKVVTFEIFDEIASECEKNQFLELQWEVYASLGEIYDKRKKPQQAIVYFKKALDIIEMIASNLSESYRDSYKNQRARAKVLSRFSAKSESVKIETVEVNKNTEDVKESPDDKTTDFSNK